MEKIKLFFEIIENTPLTESVMRMRLKGDTSEITAPGTFVNIKLEGHFLRRPISVCDVEGDILTIIYKTVGKGTKEMSCMTEGSLDLLTGLGNGYDLSASGDVPVLLGGGAGVPEAISGVIASVGSVGPGLAGIGCLDNYSLQPAMAKFIYAFDMFLGRVEIYPVLIVISLIFKRSRR